LGLGGKLLSFSQRLLPKRMNLVFHSLWKKPLGFEGVVCGIGTGNARPYRGGGYGLMCGLIVDYGWRDLIYGDDCVLVGAGIARPSGLCRMLVAQKPPSD